MIIYLKDCLDVMIANGYIGIRSPDKNGNIYGRCQRYGRTTQKVRIIRRSS